MIYHRHCSNVSCALRSTVVVSEAKNCLGCGKPLTDTDEAYADLIEAQTGIRPDMVVMHCVTTTLHEERLRAFAKGRL